MSRNSSFSGTLDRYRVYEADVVDVDVRSGTISISTTIDGSGPSVVQPLYAAFGGSADYGIFSFPSVGSRVLCANVHPARSDAVQIIKVLSGENRHGDPEEVENEGRVAYGISTYPVQNLDVGDIKVVSLGGAELSLRQKSVNSEILLKNTSGSGLYIGQLGMTSKSTIVSDYHQNISDGFRVRHGPVYRKRIDGASDGLFPVSLDAGLTNHKLHAPWKMVNSGVLRGVFPGSEGSNASFMGEPRNAPLSEYRIVINEFCETSNFKGFNNESEISLDRHVKNPKADSELRAYDPKNVLHLQPNQLIEVVAGNVVNFRGECLDINYNSIRIGDGDGAPYTTDLSNNYEIARRISRRGIGYHFQLDTMVQVKDPRFLGLGAEGGSLTSKDNFIFSIDKEGVLKVNIPKSSSTGNIPYITDSNFYNPNGATNSSPESGVDGGSALKSEVIPVTLRSKKNNILLPIQDARSSMNEEGIPKRQPGVRYSNEDGYFNGFSPVSGTSGKKVRVNTTKYHNMYAAAEMLIANYVTNLHISPTTVTCSGTVHGTPINEPFERPKKELLGDGTNPNVCTFMSTVQIKPQAPAIDPGGGVIVGGLNMTVETDAEKKAVNVPYTNSFTVSKGDENSAFTVKNIDNTGQPRKDAGGRSANLNIEGSVEMSVGKDNHDGKSMVLDTAGALVAWFGKDSKGRSMIVQTDGAVMVNVGGHNGSSFNVGRFDLRVNVSNKGVLGDDDFVPEDGNNASDYLISISENGLVIAGMKPGANMIIRNDGNLMLESTNKLILAGSTIECREGNRPPRPTYKAPVSQDTPSSNGEPITPEEIVDMVACLAKITAEASED